MIIVENPVQFSVHYCISFPLAFFFLNTHKTKYPLLINIAVEYIFLGIKKESYKNIHNCFYELSHMQPQ